jgi:methyl-accepting chemotaxis protein
MNEIKTVDELIRAKNLTEEEMELFADLIKEARERERTSAELSRQTRANILKLSDGLNTIVEKTTYLSKAMEQLLDNMETLYIRSIPEAKFYRE